MFRIDTAARVALRRWSAACLLIVTAPRGDGHAPSLRVDGRALSTWCAWDSLFVPEILGRPARVSSVDPESREIVRLVVTPERIVSVEPNGTLISFIRPDAHVFGTSAANVMAKFCHFIFFFASRSSGARWVDKNPGTFLYSLDDAFALAKRFNANNFESELAR